MVTETLALISTLETDAHIYQSLEATREQLETVVQVMEQTRDEQLELSRTIAEQKVTLALEKEEMQGKTSDIIRLSAIRVELPQLEKWMEYKTIVPTLELTLVHLQAQMESTQTEVDSLQVKALETQVLANQLGIDLGEESQIRQESEQVGLQLQSVANRKSEATMKLGSCLERMEQQKQNAVAQEELRTKISQRGEKLAILEVLKQAFSQDGVPHNIIKSLLPHITAVANTILGQMTGGNMGMRFQTEKILKSNGKKEVVTLDIFIEEYGKPPLPYASKSGGEKVKSALSAILALAETKSSGAGIQLGMLFIDEPPFLDGDGTQAYCDALETIGERYKDIKIMAITHDPAMKARFPQNLDVVKTEAGSKVVMS